MWLDMEYIYHDIYIIQQNEDCAMWNEKKRLDKNTVVELTRPEVVPQDGHDLTHDHLVGVLADET